MRINNEKDWWNALEGNWNHIRSILTKFLSPTDLQLALQLKTNKDIQLSGLLEKAWAMAPDNRSIHSIPSWGIFCDLCSEKYVLYEHLIP
jgi:hypothetical protein